MSQLQDLTGRKFGDLTVINYCGKDKWNSRTWLCRCECGNVTIVATKDLNAGVTKSCGCGMKKTQFNR